MDPSTFAPYAALARMLLDEAGPRGTDGSHDAAHLLRVWRAAFRIADDEPSCDTELLAACVLLHDCVPVEKNAAERALASTLSAARARCIVASLGWCGSRVDALAHAIEAHSFSAAVAPRTLEARILQDADRLDAIGAVGVARCFYVAGRMGSSLYDATDPQARRRPLDDRRYALDHFAVKLLRLSENFQTETGRALAADRVATMTAFLAAFSAEI